MILLINVCKEKLHYLEFVKPLEDILVSKGIKFFTKPYLEMTSSDLKKADKVIICGTSLQDNKFLEDLSKFSWVKDFEKPLLGICAGMQIIGLIFGGKIRQKIEIGFYFEEFSQEFLGLNGKIEVYHLHNYYPDFDKLREFNNYCAGGGIVQAIKHRDKSIYGCLFHPEVRNKGLINNFCLI